MNAPGRGAPILPSLRRVLVAFVLLAPSVASAEPYLAVREGLKCIACHVNPTGGGMRNDFGRVYGQRMLPAVGATEYTDYELSEHFEVGGNFRFNLSSFRQSDDDTLAFETERANLYLFATPIPDRLALYIDQQFAPASLNREAWALFWNGSRNLYAKAGRLFLPFGLRLQDDSAFVRAVSGINFQTPDSGVELGLERARWSAQVALSNGSAGGGETDEGKQVTARAEFVESLWRLGTSVSYNDADAGDDRLLYSVFSSVNVLETQLLAEVDWIRDEGLDASSDDREQLATLFEINRELRAGHNLKLTFEYLDPDLDVDEDQRNRVSLVWESTPLPLVQLRLGTRQSEGIPQSVSQNADLYFAQLHVWY